MPLYARVILAAGWIVWFARFLVNRPTARTPAQIDRRARWGLLLQGAAFFLVWWHKSWDQPPELWRVAASILFFGLALLLSWTSIGELGRHWRVDAGLDADHQLVRTGAYRFVRHPIYASVLCILLATGFLITPLSRFLLAVVLCIGGTEIRVRIEDNLLASRFGDEFRAFQRSTPAYLPFLR
jgi:protein-S-isoprenylcysteine O-methyltransferase Ste14